MAGILDLHAELGVLRRLCHIGLQIDLPPMRKLGSDILWCTLFNTTLPFLAGFVVMLSMGYGALLAYVVGTTHAAEVQRPGTLAQVGKRSNRTLIARCSPCA